MIEKIKAEHPEYKVLLTFFSPSGYEVRKNYKGSGRDLLPSFRYAFPGEEVPEFGEPGDRHIYQVRVLGNYLRELGSGEYRFISFPLYFAPTSYFSNGSESRTGRCYLIFNHLFVQDERSMKLFERVRYHECDGDRRYPF